jgi:hypothetical protein
MGVQGRPPAPRLATSAPEQRDFVVEFDRQLLEIGVDDGFGPTRERAGDGPNVVR